MLVNVGTFFFLSPDIKSTVYSLHLLNPAHFFFWPNREACVADITLLQQLTCVKQG